jgi:hypothetical protein
VDRAYSATPPPSPVGAEPVPPRGVEGFWMSMKKMP